MVAVAIPCPGIACTNVHELMPKQREQWFTLGLRRLLTNHTTGSQHWKGSARKQTTFQMDLRNVVVRVVSSSRFCAGDSRLAASALGTVGLERLGVHFFVPALPNQGLGGLGA